MKRPSSVALATALLATACATAPALLDPPPLADLHTPAAGVVTSGRLQLSDVALVAASGIREVIDLTPDAETPDFDEASAVRSAGLAYANLPLRGAVDLTRANVAAFDALLRDAKQPVLVHCASGNRVGAMAALRAAWIDKRPVDEAMEIGRAWGLKGLEGEVRQRIDADAAGG